MCDGDREHKRRLKGVLYCEVREASGGAEQVELCQGPSVWGGLYFV